MKLQVAFDCNCNTQIICDCVDRISGYIDFIEVGTPLIIEKGLLTIQELRPRYPHLKILADLKIMDGGFYEANAAFEAGADIVVGAHPHCLQGFAFEHGKHVAYSLGNFWFNMDTVETGFLSVRITAPGEYSVQFEPCIQHGGRTTLMEDAEGAALLQYLRALSPGVRIYADGTLELEQPEL